MKNKMKIRVLSLALLLVGALGIFRIASALSGQASVLVENWYGNVSPEQSIGAVSSNATGLTELTVSGESNFTGAMTASSISATSITNSGAITYLESSSNLTATTSITSAMSGKTFYVSGNTSTWTLPATSSAIIGANYRFVVGGALNVTSSVKTASGADEIEGTLIVAGAVVDCDAEDEIQFGASLENIGDYVEFRWSGTYWMLGDSGALTTGALVCTKT